MTIADEQRKHYDSAIEYVSKVGKAEPHFQPCTFGRVNSLKVTTQICHQSHPSATNYWNDDKFDEALSSVIKQEFNVLASKALILMKTRADTALVGEKAALLARLQEIEQIEIEERSPVEGSLAGD